MQKVIHMFQIKKLIRWVGADIGCFLLATFFILGGQEGRAADDLGYMIEDFEGGFISVSGNGSIPSGWSVRGPEEVVFSKGTDSHHGQSGLSAEATYHTTNYTVLEAVLLGQPGAEIDLQIQAKAATSGTAEAVFDASYDSIIGGTTIHHFHKTTHFWYDYSSSDWLSMTLEDIEVPSNGALPLSISVAHTTSSGSTDFNFDCLTSDASFTISTSYDGGYNITSELWAKAVLQVPGSPVTLIWKEVGSDATPSGDTVVSGYFYADPNAFAYGSVYNPELFVKIYIASNGWCNIAFNHVTVDDVSVYSAHNYSGAADMTGNITLNDRLEEHQYNGVGPQ